MFSPGNQTRSLRDLLSFVHPSVSYIRYFIISLVFLSIVSKFKKKKVILEFY